MKLDKLIDYLLFPLKIKEKRWMWILLAIEGIFFLILAELGSDSFASTILPFCINWNYYYIICLVFLFLTYVFNKFILNKNDAIWQKILLTTILCVLMLNVIFVPNRYIRIDGETSEKGMVIDVDTYFLNKSSTSMCYIVKIKFNDSNNTFWYNNGKKKVELNDSCELTTHTGIWKLKYVDNVEFIR